MRDLLILALLIVFTLWALKAPWIGVMGWTLVSLMSPHNEFGYAAATWPVATGFAVATLIGTLFVAIIYVAIVAIGMLLVPQATLAASDAPFVTILDSLLGAGSARWLALFVVISGLGCLNGWTLLVGELGRTLATNKLLPEVLGRSNRFGAPWVGLLVTGAVATFVGLMNYSDSLVAGFTLLSVIVTAANLPMYLCCALAVYVLWRRVPGALPPKLWLAGAGGIAFAAFAFIGVGKEPFLWALALAAAGVPIYFWMRWRHPAAAIAGTAQPQ